MKRACLTCRRAFEPESRYERHCPEHRAEHAAEVEARRARYEPWRFVYDLPRWATVRRRVLLRDGQCRAVIAGERCSAIDGLEVHHVEPLADLYGRAGSRAEFVELALSERNLAALCPAHHRRADALRRGGAS
jgi:5-methylcytosine-specific restriction endonuclease McrA